jgi:hypothetical protein
LGALVWKLVRLSLTISTLSGYRRLLEWGVESKQNVKLLNL